MIDIIANTIGARGLFWILVVVLIIDIGLAATVEVQKSRLAVVTDNNATLSAELQMLGEEVVAQNGAIDQMLVNAAKAADRLHAAEAEAGKIQVITQERIQYVLQAAIPVTCPEAVTWGAGHAIQIGKRWQGERQ